MTFDVVGLGCACLDFLGVIPKKPEVDSQVWMSNSTQQGGGKVATALAALAKLGASTTFLGKIGDDSAGRIITKEFRDFGVNTRHMIIESGASSLISMILVDESSGKRTIMSDRPTNTEFLVTDIPVDLIKSARFLHLDGTSRRAAVAAARIARQAEVPVVLDADILVCDNEIEPLIGFTDVLITSQGFSESFTGITDPLKAAETMSSYGPTVTIVTMGPMGSVGVFDGHVHRTPGFEVEVVDTTGAGDVYHGAFIFGLLHKWSFVKSAEFASAVAAMSCTKLGGRAGIPGLEQAVSFLQERNSLFFKNTG